MKWTAITLTVLMIILSVLYFTVGGTILLIGLSTIGLLTIILSCFFLGTWYTHKSIQLGANLVIEAQNNNDKWDSIKMKSLAQFGGEMLRLKENNQINGDLPLLNQDDGMFDAPFTITGVDNE